MCIIQSETFELLDCIKYDKALTGNYNNIWNITGGILRRGTEYSTFEEETVGTTGNIYTTINNEGTIEFEYYQVDGTNTTTSITFANSSNNNRCTINISNIGGSVGEWIPIKIEYTSTQAVFTNLNTEQSYTKAVSDTDVSRFKLGTYNDMTSFRFKNVKIY